jgi:hypothetical protein
MKYAPYSYSKMSTFKCKNKFKLQYIDKIRTPFNKSVAMEIGSFKHYGLEKFLERSTSFQKDILNFKFDLVDEVKKVQVFAELRKILESDTTQEYLKQDKLEIEMGFGLTFNDSVELGKYSKDCHIRGYIDLMYYDKESKIAYIIDHKTGRTRKNQDPLQLQLYYIVAMLKYPDAIEVRTQFNFVDNNDVINTSFFPEDFEEVTRIVLDYINDIESEKEFSKSEHYCNYCQFMKSGHCQGVENDLLSGKDDFKLSFDK